jgi:hypothetical protein
MTIAREMKTLKGLRITTHLLATLTMLIDQALGRTSTVCGVTLSTSF